MKSSSQKGSPERLTFIKRLLRKSGTIVAEMIANGTSWAEPFREAFKIPEANLERALKEKRIGKI